MATVRQILSNQDTSRNQGMNASQRREASGYSPEIPVIPTDQSKFDLNTPEGALAYLAARRAEANAQQSNISRQQQMIGAPLKRVGFTSRAMKNYKEQVLSDLGSANTDQENLKSTITGVEGDIKTAQASYEAQKSAYEGALANQQKIDAAYQAGLRAKSGLEGLGFSGPNHTPEELQAFKVGLSEQNAYAANRKEVDAFKKQLVDFQKANPGEKFNFNPKTLQVDGVESGLLRSSFPSMEAYNKAIDAYNSRIELASGVPRMSTVADNNAVGDAKVAETLRLIRATKAPMSIAPLKQNNQMLSSVLRFGIETPIRTIGNVTRGYNVTKDFVQNYYNKFISTPLGQAAKANFERAPGIVIVDKIAASNRNAAKAWADTKDSLSSYSQTVADNNSQVQALQESLANRLAIKKQAYESINRKSITWDTAYNLFKNDADISGLTNNLNKVYNSVYQANYDAGLKSTPLYARALGELAQFLPQSRIGVGGELATGAAIGKLVEGIKAGRILARLEMVAEESASSAERLAARAAKYAVGKISRLTPSSITGIILNKPITTGISTLSEGLPGQGNLGGFIKAGLLSRYVFDNPLVSAAYAARIGTDLLTSPVQTSKGFVQFAKDRPGEFAGYLIGSQAISPATRAFEFGLIKTAQNVPFFKRLYEKPYELEVSSFKKYPVPKGKLRNRVTIILKDQFGRIIRAVDRNTGQEILLGGGKEHGQNLLQALKSEFNQETGLKFNKDVLSTRKVDTIRNPQDTYHVYEVILKSGAETKIRPRSDVQKFIFSKASAFDNLVPRRNELYATGIPTTRLGRIEPFFRELQFLDKLAGVYTKVFGRQLRYRDALTLARYQYLQNMGKIKYPVGSSNDLLLGGRNAQPSLVAQVPLEQVFNKVSKTEYANMRNELVARFGDSVSNLTRNQIIKEYTLWKGGLLFREFITTSHLGRLLLESASRYNVPSKTQEKFTDLITEIKRVISYKKSKYGVGNVNDLLLGGKIVQPELELIRRVRGVRDVSRKGILTHGTPNTLAAGGLTNWLTGRIESQPGKTARGEAAGIHLSPEGLPGEGYVAIGYTDILRRTQNVKIELFGSSEAKSPTIYVTKGKIRGELYKFKDLIARMTPKQQELFYNKYYRGQVVPTPKALRGGEAEAILLGGGGFARTRGALTNWLTGRTVLLEGTKVKIESKKLVTSRKGKPVTRAEVIRFMKNTTPKAVSPAYMEGLISSGAKRITPFAKGAIKSGKRAVQVLTPRFMTEQVTRRSSEAPRIESRRAFLESLTPNREQVKVPNERPRTFTEQPRLQRERPRTFTEQPRLIPERVRMPSETPRPPREPTRPIPERPILNREPVRPVNFREPRKEEERRRKKIGRGKTKRKQLSTTLPTVFEQLTFGGTQGRRSRTSIKGFEVFRFH